MLGRVDHVGYLAADLDGAVSRLGRLFGLEVTRPVDLPQFSVLGVFLGSGPGNIEVFTLTDPALLAERLGTMELLLDHVAYEVADIVREARVLAAEGVRFCGPDRAQEVSEPFELGGVRHLWTVPESISGQSLQLLQR